MNTFVIFGVCALFVIYSVALVLVGMGISTKYNRQAWEKFYEGKKEAYNSYRKA